MKQIRIDSNKNYKTPYRDACYILRYVINILHTIKISHCRSVTSLTYKLAEKHRKKKTLALF